MLCSKNCTFSDDTTCFLVLEHVCLLDQEIDPLVQQLRARYVFFLSSHINFYAVWHCILLALYCIGDVMYGIDVLALKLAYNLIRFLYLNRLSQTVKTQSKDSRGFMEGPLQTLLCNVSKTVWSMTLHKCLLGQLVSR